MRHDSSLYLALGGGLDDDCWFARLAAYRDDAPFGKLGEYVVLAEAGRGGQGVVYKALQPRTRRVIAIKCITAIAAGSSAFRARFEREVRTTAALRHPNIVHVLGCDVLAGQLLLLMEYVEGVPTDRWAEGRPVREIVALFERIAHAVAHAHHGGIIHRDLKPSNVLDAQGEPHVLDFGLARLLSPLAPESASVTHSGAFIGTPLYASPKHLSRARASTLSSAGSQRSATCFTPPVSTGWLSPRAPRTSGATRASRSSPCEIVRSTASSGSIRRSGPRPVEASTRSPSPGLLDVGGRGRDEPAVEPR